VTRVALRGLAGRKIRAALTAIAIVLGVALVSGAFVVGDTLGKAADSLQGDAYEGIDGVATARASFETEEWTQTPPFREEALARVRAVPEVEDAIGGILDQARLVDADGDVIGEPPNFAVGVDADEPGADTLNPLGLAQGRWAARTGEIAIDVGTAEREGLAIGAPVGVVGRAATERFRIVGLTTIGETESLGTATIAAFDLATAQRLLEKPGQLDSISFTAADGVSASEARRAVAEALPPSFQVQTADEADPFTFGDLKEFVDFIQIFLIAFGGIALFVGAFIIFNTFSITVAQRAREFALLRSIGASRRQVLVAVILEALVIGLAATVVGIAAGLAVAVGLFALMDALNLSLPRAETVFATRTVLVGLAVGVLVTLVAGLVPAVRATRVPPVAILREGALAPRSRLAPIAPYLAVAAIAAGAALLVYGMFADDVDTFLRIASLVVGVLGLFLGVALVSPRLVRPLAWAVGAPSARLGGAAGRLARENATRNPGRTAVTASALMIGLALVTFAAVLGSGFRETWGSTIDKQVEADYVLVADTEWEGFSSAAIEPFARTPGIEALSPVRDGQARAVGHDSTPFVSGVDGDTIARFYRFDWVEGGDDALAQLGRDGAVVLEDWAEDQGLGVDGRFTLATREGARLPVVVRGIYRSEGVDSLLGDVVISTEAFDATFARPRNGIAFVDVDEGISREALERPLARYPDVRLQTQEEFVDDSSQWISDMLSLIYALLGLSVVVSFFGIVNTLVLSTFERTRELGMLRAVGMTRRQMRRMVRHESVITALIGAALGVLLGIALAALVTRRLSEFSTSEGGEGMAFSIPLGTLVVFTLVAVVAGILAAILPARRAARMRILDALHYE
jgi:putative ABC transport system permease protein